MSIVLKDGTVLPDIPTAYDNFADEGLPAPSELKHHAIFKTLDGGCVLFASDVPFAYFSADGLTYLYHVLSDSIMQGVMQATTVWWRYSEGAGWVEANATSWPLFGEGNLTVFSLATQDEHGDVWACVGTNTGVSIDGCYLMWSDYDIRKSTDLDPETMAVNSWEAEPYHKSDVSKPPFILPDGTELPALPDGCFDGTPYGLIVKTTDVYALYSAERAMYVSPFEENGHNYLVVPSGFVRLFGLINEQWMEQPGGELLEDYPLFDVASVVCAWSNHDLLTATAKNDDDSYTIGTEIARQSDENYRVTGGYMTSIANEARRLGGKTGGMLPAVTEETLRGVTAGGGDNYPDAENVNFGTTVSGKDLYTGKYFYGTCPYATKLPEADESTTEKPYIVLAKFSPSGSIGVYFTSVKPYVMNSDLVIQGADFDEWKLNAETGELEFVASYNFSSTSPTCSELYWANFELTNRSGSRVYLIPTEPVPETTMEIEYTATGETYTISGATLNDLGAVTQQITGIAAATPSEMVAALQMYAGTH